MSRRTLIILLIVSGGLNLFLAGVIVTSIVIHQSRHGGMTGPDRQAGFRLFRAVRGLDEPHRSRARALWKEKRREIRARIRAVREARRDLGAMLRKGDASASAIEAGFKRLHDARGDAQTALHALVRQIVEKLTPEQRKRFYRTAFRPRKMGRQRHRRERREDRRERRE